MNKQEDLIEDGVIREEGLEKVTGGEGPGVQGKLCYFEPAVPIRSERRGGSLWVECRSRCHSWKKDQPMCSCWHEDNCVGRMHKVEKFAPRVYYPERYGSNNHHDKTKVVIFDKEPDY